MSILLEVVVMLIMTPAKKSAAKLFIIIVAILVWCSTLSIIRHFHCFLKKEKKKFKMEQFECMT